MCIIEIWFDFRLSEKEHKKVHASAAKEEKVRKVKNTAVSFISIYIA